MHTHKPHTHIFHLIRIFIYNINYITACPEWCTTCTVDTDGVTSCTTCVDGYKVNNGTCEGMTIIIKVTDTALVIC